MKADTLTKAEGLPNAAVGALAELERIAHDAELGALPELAGGLERVKIIIMQRVVERHPPHIVSATADVTSDLEEVAKIVGRSVSWIRKRGHLLPGFHQPGGKGTRVGWSRRALHERWSRLDSDT